MHVGAGLLGCPQNESCDFVADSAALSSPNPLAATVRAATAAPGDDGTFAFTLATLGRVYGGEITTANGTGQQALVFAFAGQATLSEDEAPGWDVVANTCPATAGVVTLNASAACTFTNERQPIGNVVPIGVQDAQGFSEFPDHYADFASSNFVAVNGGNGFAVYNENTFGAVTALTQLNTFNFSNVLNSFWWNAPDGDDPLWMSRYPSGTSQTVYVTASQEFGAQLVSSEAVRDATRTDGDPNSDTGFYVTADGTVVRQYLDAFGGTQSFPISLAYVQASDLPSGYLAVSAFKTSDSAKVLIAARNTTPGENGAIFLADDTTPFGGAVNAGAIGVDPKLLRCARRAPDSWLCGVTDGASTELIDWDGGGSAGVFATVTTGVESLGLALRLVGDAVQVVATSYDDDTATLVTTRGGLVASSTVPMPAGCTRPSSARFRKTDGVPQILCNQGANPTFGAIVNLTGGEFPASP